MTHCRSLGLLLAGASALVVASAALCGDKNPKACRRDQYCVQDSFCSGCDPVCSHTSHNYEPTVCSENCFDYIVSFYDQRNQTELLKVVSSTSSDAFAIAVASLALLVLLLVLALTILLGLWLKYRKVTAYYQKGNMKKKKIESIKAVCVNHRDGSRKLHLEMPVPVADVRDTAPSAVTAMTPLSTRHPAEDATLEYAAYDNPTLNTSTPNTTPKTPRTETAF